MEHMHNKEFKIGDIVYHKCGRICNGKYGFIVVGPYGDLDVIDNEGAPEMSVKGNEHLIRVVGNIKDNPELLNEWSYQNPLYSIEDLRDFYKKYQNHITDDFDKKLEEFKGRFRYEIISEAFTNLLIQTLKDKYPNFLIINEGVPDSTSSIGIGIFNVPDEIYSREFKSEIRSIEDECYEIARNLSYEFTQDEFDVLFFIRNVSTTKEHYQYITDKYNEKGEKKCI